MAFTINVVIVSVVLVFMHSVHSTADCPSSAGFRVFYERRDVQTVLKSLPPREQLTLAAKTWESRIVRMTRSTQLGIAEEGARLNIDCLPWLSRLSPEGSIRWYYILLDEFGNPGNF